MSSYPTYLESEGRYTFGLNIPSDLSVTLVIVEKDYLAKEAGGVSEIGESPLVSICERAQLKQRALFPVGSNSEMLVG